MTIFICADGFFESSDNRGDDDDLTFGVLVVIMNVFLLQGCVSDRREFGRVVANENHESPFAAKRIFRLRFDQVAPPA